MSNFLSSFFSLLRNWIFLFIRSWEWGKRIDGRTNKAEDFFFIIIEV